MMFQTEEEVVGCNVREVIKISSVAAIYLIFAEINFLKAKKVLSVDAVRNTHYLLVL